jgi:hypothetical protein
MEKVMIFMNNRMRKQNFLCLSMIIQDRSVLRLIKTVSAMYSQYNNKKIKFIKILYLMVHVKHP